MMYLTLLFEQERIRESPFEYVVLPAATHAPQSQAIGEGVHGAIAGKQQSFSIIPKDAFGNFRGWPLQSMSTDERHLDVFHATAVSECDVINVDVTYDASTRYFVATYTPRISGQYQLNILYEAKGISTHIHGSPFAVDVIAGATRAHKSIAFESDFQNDDVDGDFEQDVPSFDFLE